LVIEKDRLLDQRHAGPLGMQREVLLLGKHLEGS